MIEQLYVFKGEGVAEGVAYRRAGARYALMAFASAASIDTAQSRASSFVAANGWVHVTFGRGAEVSVAPSEMGGDDLKSALQEAIETGVSYVTYSDELPPNA